MTVAYDGTPNYPKIPNNPVLYGGGQSLGIYTSWPQNSPGCGTDTFPDPNPNQANQFEFYNYSPQTQYPTGNFGEKGNQAFDEQPAVGTNRQCFS